jgi:glutamate-1-semialdehyde 2,1-aminomutase
VTTTERILGNDAELRKRASAVIPGGMYGHQNAAMLPQGFPQFMARGQGARVWDVDGNEYVDLMCSYGPVLVGHNHPRVEEAARRQAALADCQNGPSERMVELAEQLVAIVRHAEWAMFAKNGTDATTMCTTIARAATGRRKLAVAKGAYHGAAPWCTPVPTGTLADDRAHLVSYVYNDLGSVERAVDEAGDDLAGIITSPFKHDAGFDQELPDPDFARGLRRICDETGAALILDDVRCGFRLAFGSSWEPLGVDPDLCAWSKALANGRAIAAVTGTDRFRDAASSIFVTGSFWFGAVPMAAALATLSVLRDEGGLAVMEQMGQRLRDGMEAQAAELGVEINQTGPVQMPFLTFEGDRRYSLANVFSAEAAARGLYLHPRHNWFVSAAMTDADVDMALSATQAGFRAVARAITDARA